MEQMLKELGIKNTNDLNRVMEVLEQKQIEILDRLDNVADEKRRIQLENMLKKVEKTLLNLGTVCREKDSGIKRDVQNFEYLKKTKGSPKVELQYENRRNEMQLDEALGLLGTPEFYRGLDAIHHLGEKGHVEAQLIMGNMYYCGERVGKDYLRAFEWYAKAAGQGNEEAIGLLNRMCKRNEIDSVRKVKWWSTRSLDDVEAFWGLGKAYACGDGVERNCQLAEEYFEKAVDKNRDKSLHFEFELGKMYEYGRGLEQNYKKAISWYEKSEDIAAKYYLARIYSKGYGGEINIAKAKECYADILDLSKRLGHGSIGGFEAETQLRYILGRMYRFGEGVEMDLYQADRYYAENRHHADSLYERGLINNNRSVLEENVKHIEQLMDEHNKKMEMLKKHDRKQLVIESPKGLSLLGQYQRAKELAERAEKWALTSFQEALEEYEYNAKRGEINAMYMLSRMFFCGHGVEQNIEKAKEYCQRAVDKYDTQAIEFMKVINFAQKNEAAIPHMVKALSEG